MTKYIGYKEPTTAEEYWNNVDRYWADLYNILAMFLNRAQLQASDPDKMRLEKNPEIARLFNAAWFNAPDDYSIHSIPAWHVLCDLCSEEYVLHEELDEGEIITPDDLDFNNNNP